MDTQLAGTVPPSAPNRSYFIRMIAAALADLVISAGVSMAARNQGWPHRISIAFATFLFLIPILQPSRPGHLSRSWPSRVGTGIVFALIGGLFCALVLDR